MIGEPPRTAEPGGDLALRAGFLQGMSFAACTVNVVTTDGAGGRAGVTVSAMSSVSADTPRPTLLVCIHHRSAAADAILENGVFCVNVLRDDQSFISDCFAGRRRTESGDKFDCTEWAVEKTGATRVKDPLVAFDCRVVSAQRIGTHHVFFGEVEAIFGSGAGSPLIYANRAYGTPSRIEPLPPRMPAEASGRDALRLGVFHTFGPYVVPEILCRLAEGGREPELRLVEGDQRRVVESLKAGHVDLALLYDFGLSEELETETLAEIAPHVLLAASHPLSAKPVLSLAELAGEPMVLLDSAPSGDYFLSLFAAAGLQTNVRFRSSSFEMVRGLVARGFGFSLLATKPASAMSYDGSALAARPLADRVEPSRVVLAARPGGLAAGAAQGFVRECRRLFSRPPAGRLPPPEEFAA